MNGFLVLDSSTLLNEVGLTSKRASALKYYLFMREIGLVVLEIVAQQECRDKLAKRAKGMRDRAQDQMRMLANFMGRVSGWTAPSDEAIEQRSIELSIAKHLRASVWPTSPESNRRAMERLRCERPPSHRNKKLNDCIIWEHCLDILRTKDVTFVSEDTDFNDCIIWEHCLDILRTKDVTFVSEDTDFRNIGKDSIHSDLLREAESVPNRSFRFFHNVESLLDEIKCKIDTVPTDDMFRFIYDEITTRRLELEQSSGCGPSGTGVVQQTALATGRRDLVELRLDVQDTWANDDGSKICSFRLRGSCLLDLFDRRPFELTPSLVRLTAKDSDGSVRSVKGSVVALSGTLHAGAAPIVADTDQDVKLTY